MQYLPAFATPAPLRANHPNASSSLSSSRPHVFPISTFQPTMVAALDVHDEVQRRRNLAIVSHPDAGKSTLTEKLLLYGGAIQQAGTVRARRAERNVSSDWMKMEQERGISITSAVLTFEYDQKRITIVDCPGHGDVRSVPSCPTLHNPLTLSL